MRHLIAKLGRFPAALISMGRPGIRLLMYHRIRCTKKFDQLSVDPELFDEHMALLSKNYHVVSLADAVSQLETGKIISNSVAITLDDGYLDNLEFGLPIIEKHNIPATIFVTTTFADQNNQHSRYPADDKRLHLDWSEIKALSKHPLITIGSHTLTHPFLQRASLETATNEIVGSKQTLEDQLNCAVDFFCYPSGDFTPREETLVWNAGYRAAVSVAPGLNRASTNRAHLRRTEITNNDQIKFFAAKLNGSFDFVHSILHAKRTLYFRQAAYSQRG